MVLRCGSLTNTDINVNSHIQELEGLTHSRTVILNTDEKAPKIHKTGKSIIKLYYDRNKYDLQLYVDGALLRTDQIAYGATLLEPGKPTKQGYIFDGWYQDAAMMVKYSFGHTMPTKTVKLYGKYTPSTDTKYEVVHYVEQLNGDFTYQKTDEKSGTTDEMLTLDKLKDSAIIIDGGISYMEAKVGGEIAETAKILPDGSLVVALYYQRESHTLTFNPENGKEAITREGKYGSIVTPPTVTKLGYTFAGWSPAAPDTMPVADASYTAQWTARTDTAYTVEHYWQDATGTGYSWHETTPHSGTTGQTVTAEAKSYPSFTLNEAAPEAVNEGTIAADGSLVLKRYYDRDQFTITFDPNGGTLTGAETQTLRHGATVTTAVPALTGYYFGGWYLDPKCTVAFDGIMPAKNVTVYARWSEDEVSYKVYHYVMDVNGHYSNVATATDNKTATTGTELRLSTLKNSGHEVENGIFYKEAKVGGVVAEEATVLADGTLCVELYYEREDYTLAWNLNGGTTTADGTAAGKVFYDAPLTAPTVTKTGYLQNGWNPAFNGKMPAQDVTYTAQWSKADYNITYLDVGGADFSGVHGASYPTTHTYGAATKLVSPTKENYTFAGWFTDETGSGTPVTELAAEHADNVILYAKWSARSYGITYHLNGGTNAGNPATYSYGTPVYLQIPTKTGYTFIGWYTDEGLTAKVENPVITATDSGDKAFYAKWQATNYTITYDINIGGVTNTNAKSYTIETETITLKDVTKQYYRFDGWFTNEACTEAYRITQIVKGSTGNMTIYGKLTEVGMKITYQLEGGVNHESNPEYYRIGDGKVNLQDPTREGYDFTGWDMKETLMETRSNVTYLEFSTYPYILELKAKWKAKEVKLTYHDFSPDEVSYVLPTTMTFGESISLPTRIYSKAGGTYSAKQFLGIYTTSDFSGDPLTKLEGFTEDTTLYVKWADGSENNPYLLRDKDDLMRIDSVFKLNASTWSRFKITNNISIAYTLTNGSSEITDGILGKEFVGEILPGDKYVSFNLTLNQLSPLFNEIKGILRNFKVSATINTAHIAPSEKPMNYGLFASETWTSSLIENCHVTSATIYVTFSGDAPDGYYKTCNLGSVVGASCGEINNVTTTCKFSVLPLNGLEFSVGGIAGAAYYGEEIRNCRVDISSEMYASDPTYNGYLGGIVGVISSGAKFNNCTVKFRNYATYPRYPALSTILCDENGNVGSGSITQSTGILAGYLPDNQYASETVINNIRVIPCTSSNNANGNFPLIGIMKGNATLKYIYISTDSTNPVKAENLFTIPKNYEFYQSRISCAASVNSTDIFPTNQYLTRLVEWANSYVPSSGTTLVKDAMNGWVTDQNRANPGKYKLWE